MPLVEPGAALTDPAPMQADYEGLKQAFADFIVHSSGLVDTKQAGDPVKLEDVPALLAARTAEWKAQAMEEGRRDARARVVAIQLEQRFGVLPDTVKQQIDVADTSTLQDWIDRLLTAASIANVIP